jgi:predicted nucleic acid-binding protein
MDLLHVAAALELDAELFLTFDNRQFQTAKAAGLKAVFPGKGN